MPRESQPERQARTQAILRTLKAAYPDARCALVHADALQLLVATILSAQCTDVRVNLVTPQLFARYPSAQALAEAEVTDLEALIQSTGFYRNKAKAIRETARELVAKYGGKVPDSMEELTSLRGVGRKTANVVLGNVFGKNEGVVVDTHVGRLSLRLGLTTHEDPVKAEQDLMKLVPREEWTLWSHLLIFHGRKICTARNPKCPECPVLKWCPTGQKNVVTSDE